MYLYIQDDLSVKQSANEPEVESLVDIVDGSLVVVEFRPLENSFFLAEVEEAEDGSLDLSWNKVTT